jgi:hypothetical protein
VEVEDDRLIGSEDGLLPLVRYTVCMMDGRDQSKEVYYVDKTDL